MSRSLVRSLVRSGAVRSLLAGGVALASLCTVAFSGSGCGDTVHNNEGACVAQTSVDPASGCDGAKFSYYTCPGAAKPTLDAGSCTFSSVHGGFCCPLPTQVGNASQKGQIINILEPPTTPIAGVTIDFGNGITTTSDATGAYVLQIKQNTPFSMVLNAPTYAQLTDQEWMLTGDFDALQTHLVPASLQTLVYGGLAGYDDAKSTLGVGVEITGACADNAGAVIAVSDPGATVVYFTNVTPNTGATSVQSGSVNPSALIYNIAPGTTPTVTITPPPGCTNIPYPYTDGPVTYTGKFTLGLGSAAASFFRAFVK